MSSTVLVIYNYASFPYNLVQSLALLGAEVTVRRNDRLDLETAKQIDPTHLLISPGPGEPDDAGISVDLVRALRGQVPILGVCLGHQSIASAFGAQVVRAPRLMHGKASSVYHDARSLYQGLPNPFQAGRYHSLAVADESLPDELQVSAYTSEGEVMGLRHRELAIEGVQFHPELSLTPEGDRLLRNFLDFSEPSGTP